MATVKTVRQHAVERRRKKISMKKAQDLIPVQRYIGDGIFLCDDVYIKSWEFSNINFNLLSREQEDKVLKKWWETLNGFEPGATYKYTVIKKKFDIGKYQKDRLLELKDDKYDDFRRQYNDMITTRIKDTRLIQERRIFQAAIKRYDEQDARGFFERSQPYLESSFRTLGSEFNPISDKEFLKLLWQFAHMDSGDYFDELDTEMILKNKKSIRDFLSPYQFTTDTKNNALKVGGKYFRSLYVPPNSYAKYIKDTVLSELTSLEKDMCISVDIIPIQMTEAYALIEDLEFKSDLNIANFKKRQAKVGDITADPPYAMRKKAQQIEEYNYDLSERDQRLMLGHITILHSADSIDELNEDTEKLKTLARQQGCELTELTMQQEDGYITALPFGVNRFIGKSAARFRTLTTEGMASFIPFTAQEVSHKGGIFYGQNKLSKSPIFINRKSGMNGNAVILGSSGAGKSFKKKEEMIPVILNSNDKVIVIDPDREYGYIVRQMGGTVIKMSADSTDHINAMEISERYNDEGSPITLKSEAILTFYAMAEGAEQVNPKAKSVIDRCVKNVLEPYVKNGYNGKAPTLIELREELLAQVEEIAKDIALTLELYTTGSLNIFAKETNVNMDNRLICFDISNLGDNLLPIAMLIITDFISNTLSKNRDDKVYTWVDIDELYLMFMREYTATFFFKLWKRIRKYGGLCTGITQDLADLLKSPTARTMLANSDFLILLSANEADSVLIKELLNLDETQMSYITDVGQKNGMIKLGRSFIPITDDFPKETALYKIMSTKFEEEIM